MESFAQENKEDLQKLGLLFMQMLAADFKTLPNQPSPTLQFILRHDSMKTLGTRKGVTRLIHELKDHGVPLVTDVSGESILKL
jgi:peptidoglycan/xylan/chitin deacetylase (PgdA/CDA1 family)